MNTLRLAVPVGGVSASPQFTFDLWRASVATLQVGFFRAGAVQSLAGLQSVTLRLRAAPLATEVLLQRTVAAAAFGSMTQAQWLAGTHQQLTILLTSEELALAMTERTVVLHATFSGLRSDGSTWVMASGHVVLHDANAGPGDLIPPDPEPAVTGPEVAALIAVETAARVAADAALDLRVDALEAAGSDVTWETLQGKPATFPPSSHTHSIANVTGLQTALDGKANRLPAQNAIPESYLLTINSEPSAGDYFLLHIQGQSVAFYFTQDGVGSPPSPAPGLVYAVDFSPPQSVAAILSLLANTAGNAGFWATQINGSTIKLTQPVPGFVDWSGELTAVGNLSIALDQAGAAALPERLAAIDGRNVTGVLYAVEAGTAQSALDSQLLGGQTIAQILAQTGMVPLVSATANTVAAVTFDTVFSTFTDYDDFVVVVDNLAPTTDNVALRVRLRSAFASLTGTYNWGVTFLPTISGTATNSVNQSATTGWVPLNTNMGNSTNEINTLILEIFPRRSGWPHVLWRGFYTNTSTQPWAVSGGGSYQAAVNPDGIRFEFSTGNIATGRFTVFGRRKSS